MEVSLEEQLDQTTKFLINFDFLFNYTIDENEDITNEDFNHFFVKDQWNKRVPKEWQEPLQNLTIKNLIEVVSEGKTDFKIPDSLKTFIKKSKQFSISKESIELETISIGNEKKIKPKKKHEVERMTKFISNLAQKHDCKTIIDIGSGRGYISNLLSTKYGLNVIGIDNQENITESSIKRNKNEIKNENLNLITSHIDMNLSVEEFQKLLEPYMKKDENFMLIGLHTCGDLGSTVLKLYEKSTAKALVNVGCCYHRLTEEENLKKLDEKFIGFPLSEQCKNSKIILNYGKILGNLSLNSWNVENYESSIYHFRRNSFRVALEYLLISNVKDVKIKSRFRIKVSTKNTNNFANYAINGISVYLEKQPELFKEEILKISKSKEEFTEYLTKFYSQFDPDEAGIIKKVACYWSLRALLGPVIESVILSDRVLYLKEKKLKNTDLLRIFDYEISPRGLMIVSAKE
eukprot:gene574-8084_t